MGITIPRNQGCQYLSLTSTMSSELNCMCFVKAFQHNGAMLQAFKHGHKDMIMFCSYVKCSLCICDSTFSICIVRRSWACLPWKSAIEIKSLLFIITSIIIITTIIIIIIIKSEKGEVGSARSSKQCREPNPADICGLNEKSCRQLRHPPGPT